MLTNENPILRSRSCMLLRLMGRFCCKSLRLFWNKELKNDIETLAFDSCQKVRSVSLKISVNLGLIYKFWIMYWCIGFINLVNTLYLFPFVLLSKKSIVIAIFENFQGVELLGTQLNYFQISLCLFIHTSIYNFLFLIISKTGVLFE